MNLYDWNGGVLVSDHPLEGFESVDAGTRRDVPVYRLNHRLSRRDRVRFRMNHSSQWSLESEDVSILNRGEEPSLPEWIRDAINGGRTVSINGAHPDWRHPLAQWPERWRVNLVGLGDVGGILLSGLRLLGSPDITRLGIYDPDNEKVQRWRRELGQICFPFEPETDMSVEPVELGNLFDCDLFIFCASRGVPAVGSTLKDVRTVQFEGNSAILAPYVRQACEKGFKGIFAVVSDPVDHLSRFVLEEALRFSPETGGLKPEQVRGYGLGVMNGRARWYASQDRKFAEYLHDGRAYGPHGNGLIIANSISRYSKEKTRALTALTENANHEVRNSGFKPYVAPALSSGAISILKTVRGQWHYSAVSLGGTFMGCCNRISYGYQETEALELPTELMQELWSTYKYLGEPL